MKPRKDRKARLTPQQFEFPRAGLPSLKLNTRTVYLILGILLALWLLSGVYTVDTDEQAIILRFGKYKELAGTVDQPTIEGEIMDVITQFAESLLKKTVH